MAETKANRIVLRKVRCSYFYGFKQYEGEGGKKKYTTHGILERTHLQFAELQALIKKVAFDKWGDKAADTIKTLAGQDRLCLHNGDTAKPGLEAYAGKVFISASNDTRPTIVDANNSPLTEADGKPVSGDYIDLIVDVWAQANQFGKRINASFAGARFREKGVRLSGGGQVASADEFGAPAEDADSATPTGGDDGGGIV